MFTPPKFAWFLALAILLAGCAPGSATMIASYPQTMANPRPQPTALNNSSRLALEVDDVPSATSQAIDLALSYGGYVVDRNCRGEGADRSPT